MTPHLRDVLDRTLALFEQDPRVLAAYMTGSVGTEKEDEFSDVDLALFIRPDDYECFDRDLRGIFEQAGVHPILWWPERINCETLRNYAVLFEREEKLVQYDITIEVAPEEQPRKVLARDVLFDKSGVLEAVEASPRPGFSPDRLGWIVEMYWLYAFIHAKYLGRGDVFKLIAAQQELFHAHLTVLHAMQPTVGSDWWPILAGQLCAGQTKQTLLSYLGHRDAESVVAALPDQLARFSADARAACERWELRYPTAFEEKVKRHLERVLDSPSGVAK